MPQYQGIWTLPVAARLQSTQQWATDPLYRNTTLLLQADNAPNGAQNNTFLDSSSNNFTITRNGNTTQGTFTPFSQSPGWWGNYFDGTGDYISAPANAAFNFGTGDFTVEFWYFPNDVAGAKTLLDINYGTAPNCTLQPSSGVMVLYYNGGNTIASSATDTAGSWYHYAIVRSGSTITMYRNGTSVGTATYSGNVGSSSVSCFIGGSLGGGGYYVNGYLSNVRIVKGTAVYTSSFTPPNAPLTAITNTSLLTCQSNRFVDNSANGFVISVAGNTSVQAFSPFAPQYQWTAPVIGGSGYFDGTGDYLSIADNAAFDFGSGDFTIEAWVYANSLGSFNGIVAQWPDNGGTTNNSFVLESVGSNMEFYWASGSTLYGPATLGTISTGTWTHYAICRSGNTLYPFRNGVLGTTVSITQTLNNPTSAVTVGGLVAGSGFWNGYISNLRILKGTALYTTAFTPPTAPLTAIANTSVLLNFTNAGIVDGTMKNNLETVGNAQVNTSVVKYGTGSMAFDGTGDYLRIQPSDLLATWFNSDYTIEYWVYPNAFASSANGGSNVYSQSDPASTSEYFSFGPRASGVVVWYYYNGAVQVVTSGTISTGVWTHLAWTYQKSSNTMRIFINGVLNTTTTIAGTPSISTTANPILVGASTTVGFNGYIDDLRVTKGIARYTANFTPPTVALPRQ